jgi:plastocyanin
MPIQYVSKMKIIFILVVTFLVFLATYQNAHANTCAVKETVLTTPQYYRVSDSVFAGTVSSISNYTYHQWKIQFNADKILKGENNTKIVVITNSLQACGYSLVVGEKYLVFANGSPLGLNPFLTEPYADAQDAISLYNDPHFQSEEAAKEVLIQKLETAKDNISNMMGSRMTFGIPFNMVGVDVLNATLDVGIDSSKATLSKTEYKQKIKDLIGNLPMKVEFMQIWATPREESISTQNDSSANLDYGKHLQMQQITQPELDKMSPMQQYTHGTTAKGVRCSNGLVLVIKTEDKTPACIRYTTANVLIERGWAMQTDLTMSSLESTVIIPTNSSDTRYGFDFTPSIVKVVIGTNNTVRWINLDSVANDITSNTGSFESGLIESGDAWTHTFDKTGTYVYHSAVHPWLRGTVIVTTNPLANLQNYTGVITLKNQTYYFVTPNYTDYVYTHPVQISFHDVTFTLFPSGFRGGLPVGCGEQYYWSNARFADNTSELLHIFAGIKCSSSPPPTDFSNHTNPQAGLIFYDGKMKLLVSEDNKTSLNQNSNSSGNPMLSSSSVPCDIPYPKSTGIPVLYMPLDSTGKICVNYYNPNGPYPAGFDILEAQNYSKKAENVTVSANPDTISQGNSTIVYTIHSGNKAGFYRMLISCPGMQLALGYDSSSNFVVNDFPWLGQTFYCGLSANFHIAGLTEIGVKYIPYP